MSTEFPAFLTLEHRPSSGARSSFLDEVAQITGGTRAQFERSFAEIDKIIDRSLGKFNGGRFNVDLGVSGLKQTAADADFALQRITALRDSAANLARTTGDTSAETQRYIQALRAQVTEAQQAKAAADSQATTYSRLQGELDGLVGAETRLAQAYRATFAEQAKSENLASNSQRAVNQLAAPALDPFNAATRNGAGFGTLAELERSSIAADEARIAMDALRRAEVGLAEGATILDAAHRGTALSIEHTSRSARESASAFDVLFQAMDARSSTAAQNFYNTALGVDAQTKSARDSARVFEDLFAAEEKAAAGAARFAQDLELVKRAIDPTRVAQQQLDVELARADAAFERGAISAREYGLAVNAAADRFQNLATNAQLGTAAQQRVADTSRSSRTAFVQLGQQMNDVTVQAQMGTSAFTIFAQQVPQAAFALSMLEGSANQTQARIGSFATFLAGPWGAAIFAGTAVLGPLIYKLLESGDAADKSAKALDTAKLASDGLSEAQSVLGGVFDLTTGAIKRQNELLLLNVQLQSLSLKADAQAARSAAAGIRDEAGLFAGPLGNSAGPVRRRGPGRVRGETSVAQQLLDQVEAGSLPANEAFDRGAKLNFSGSAISREDFNKALRATAEAVAKDATAAAIDRSLKDGVLDPSLRQESRTTKTRDRADQSGKAAERAAREMFRLSEFAADANDKIARIRQSFTDTPPAIARANDALATLDDFTSDIDEKMRRGLDPAIAADLKTELAGLRPIIEDSLNQPFRDAMDAASENAAIQNLLIAGRSAEADVLKRVLELNRQSTSLSEDQVQSVYDVVLQERARTRELEKQNELRQRDAALVDATRDNVRGAMQELARGGGASAVGKAFERQFDLLLERQIDGLFDGLFGGFFQSERDKALGFDMVKKASIEQVDAIRTTITALDDLAASVRTVSDDMGLAANDNLPGIVGADGGITVARNRLRERFDLESEFDKEFSAGPAAMAPRDFTGTLIRKLATAVGGKEFGDAVGDAVTDGLSRNGAAYGALAGGLAFGDRGSPLLSAAGGALGEKFLAKPLAKGLESIAKGLGDFAGPLGSMLGGLAGGLLSSAFTSPPRASATIGGMNGSLQVVSTRGNSASLRKASEGAAGEAIDTLDRIAEALGATINASLGSVSVGVRKGNYRVDTSGSGVTKTSRGAIDFGEDSAAAIKFATMDLIKDGVLEGLRASTQQLLKNSKDLETAVNRAVDFEGVFAELKSIRDPIGAALDGLDKEFNRLNDIFAEAGATTAEYADLEELYGFRRAEAIKQARDSFLGGLLDLRDQLTIGDTSMSLRSRLGAAQAKYDPLAE